MTAYQPKIAPPEMRAPNTPPTVVVTLEASPPVASSDLGITVTVPAPTGPAEHPLVTIGDSLTHGFQSGAIHNTDLSWPMLVARAGGYDDRFGRPHYAQYGGFPLNIEYLVRALEEKYGDDITGLNLVRAGFTLNDLMATICHYWQDGDGTIVPKLSTINENLATFGNDLRDALSLAPDNIRATIANPHESAFFPLVAHGKERAALRTLPYYDPNDKSFPSLSALQAATQVGLDGESGIETLVVMLGANNVLGTTFDLRLCWSQTGYDKLGPDGKDQFNIWQPQHFAAELAQVAASVRGIRARHVIWGTVPHVTIIPLLHGIRKKVVHGDGSHSRYFPYYTRPWFDENTFDPTRDQSLTDRDARTIDSAIDQYNAAILQTVAAARNGGLDWRIVDLCGILDRLASRRYIQDPAARPSWWYAAGGEYPLPNALAKLTPKVDSTFFLSGPAGRQQGGIIALDGVHPTTAGYGIMAQEVINVMRATGVPNLNDIDFEWLLTQDSLLSSPPRGLASDFHLAGWLDGKFDYVRHLFGQAVTAKCPKPPT
jgi:hypothetical protein